MSQKQRKPEHENEYSKEKFKFAVKKSNNLKENGLANLSRY